MKMDTRYTPQADERRCYQHATRRAPYRRVAMMVQELTDIDEALTDAVSHWLRSDCSSAVSGWVSTALRSSVKNSSTASMAQPSRFVFVTVFVIGPAQALVRRVVFLARARA